MCSLWTLWIWKNCNNLVSCMYHVSKIWLGDFVWLPGSTFRGRFTTTSTLVLHVGFPATKWREMASPSWAGGEIIMKTVGCTTRAGATRVILDVYQYSAAPFICTQHQLSSSLELRAHTIIAWFFKFFACLQESLLTMMMICPYLQPMAWGRDEKCKLHEKPFTQLGHRLARKSWSSQNPPQQKANNLLYHN